MTLKMRVIASRQGPTHLCDRYSAPDLTVDEIEHARRMALAGKIEAFTQFVNSCRSVIKNYEPPVFKYTGENVVALSSCAAVSLRTAVSRPYYGYVKKAVKMNSQKTYLQSKAAIRTSNH